MHIIRAPYLGFCQGVRRAYNRVLDLISNANGKPIVLFGELVHNREVMLDLTNRDISVIEDYTQIRDSVVITRTHGVPKHILETIKANNNEIVDLTCRIVQNLRNVANHLVTEEEVDCIVLVGHPDHSEVVATKSWIDKCYTVSCESDLDSLPNVESIGVVAQTTFPKLQFNLICERLGEKYNRVIVRNTICPHTAQNQETSKDLAAKVDLVIVVGDSTSSNTRTLVSVCSRVNPNTHLICNVTDLKTIDRLSECNSVLLTAGASAPDWVIDDIQRVLESS